MSCPKKIEPLQGGAEISAPPFFAILNLGRTPNLVKEIRTAAFLHNRY